MSPAGAPTRTHTASDETAHQAGLADAPGTPTPAPRARRTKHTPRRRIHSPVLLGILALGLLAVSGGLLFFLLPAPATIAVHPDSGRRDELISVTAVTTRPASLESQARLLSDTRTSPVLPIRATDIKQQPAIAARGQLLFYNIAPNWQQIQSGITFTLSGGLQVVSEGTVTIPPGNPPDSLGTATVYAHVVQAGAQGNIPAGTIDGLCPCGNAGVSVKNAQFSGGQDAATYTVLSQADIDGVANPERTSLLRAATAGVTAQIRRTERLATAVQCAVHEALDYQAGSRTTLAHVTVSATCHGEVYDQQDVEGRATAIFRQDMRQALPKEARLVGSPVATIAHTALSDQQEGTLALLVHVRGWWMHALDATQLSRRIAGKSYGEAMADLLRTPGVLTATVQQRGDGLLPLPADPRQITIQIIPPQITPT